jgi:hypothetical protein
MAVHLQLLFSNEITDLEQDDGTRVSNSDTTGFGESARDHQAGGCGNIWFQCAIVVDTATSRS